MTTLETNTAPVEAGGEGTRTPEKAVRWAIPLSLLACVLLAFFDKISRRWGSISTPRASAF